MPIDDLLDKLEQAERRFVRTEFLAPIIGQGHVVVRIAGVVCQLKVTAGLPHEFAGWAILRSLSTSKAEFVREASLTETAKYLALFPALRLVLVQRVVETRSPRPYWLALPAQQGDTRFRIAGPAMLLLSEDGLDRFETIVARFDGRLFWYERRDPARDPAIAAYLREQLTKQEADGVPPKPDRLHAPGLSREEREAYGFVRALLAQAQRDKIELRLSEALAHAGAELRSYVERGDVYVVTYEVDGRQHVSTVQRDDLTVRTAGICLAGQDRRFDLGSLVGVLREAENREGLVWVGPGGLDEERYWQVHPEDGPHE